MECINFLPWRQSLFKQQKRKVIYLIVINGLLLLCIAGLLQGVLKYHEHRKLQRINVFMQHYRQMEAETKRYQALQKQNQSILNDLKTFHNLWLGQHKKTTLLHAIFQMNDKFIIIERIDMTKNQLTLYGYATHAGKIHQLVNRIQNEKLLVLPKIQLKKQTHSHKVPFILEGNID